MPYIPFNIKYNYLINISNFNKAIINIIKD